ncbi:MAG: iron ABC transporter permease [Actinomycetota bacterium]
MTGFIARPSALSGTGPSDETRSTIRRAPPLFVLVPALAAALVAIAPIWYLVDRARSRGAAAVWDEIWQQRTRDLVLRSLALSITVTAACVVVGATAAWLVVRSDMPGRGVLRVALALPLAIPSYLSAFAWVSWRPSIAGFWGAVLVLTAVSYPFVYLPCVAALRHLDPAHEEVARSLGRSRVDVALGLTLRQARPAISAGGLLVMLYVLSDFGAVAAMRYEAFTWVIYGAYRAGFNPSRAAILASTLVFVALLLVVLEARARGRASSSRLGSGSARAGRPVRLGRAAPVAWLFVATVLGTAIVFPVGRVVHWVITLESATTDVADVAGALASTLGMAAAAAVATVLLAMPVGVLAARHRGRVATAIEGATYVTHALPGIVIAISLVFIGVRVLEPIYLETPLLILGYVVLFLPLAVGAVRASVEQSPIRLEEIARSLGSSPRRVVWRVTVPLAAPGIAAATGLVLLSTMKELPVTLILRPTSTQTLATRLWQYTSVSDYASAGPYALALVIFAAIPTAALTILAGRRHGAGIANG